MDAPTTAFWDEALEIVAAAPIGFLATVDGDQPLVRTVTPTFEGATAYIATASHTPKIRQIRNNPLVELMHWRNDFRHLAIRGCASLVADQAILDRLWPAFPYALSDYFDRAGRPADGKAPYGVIRIDPFRVELWSLSSLATGKPAQVWHAR